MPSRMWFNQSVFPPNSDIYFLYAFDGSTGTGSVSIAKYVAGAYVLPTPLDSHGAYPGANPGVHAGIPFTVGAAISNFTLDKQTSTFSNLLIANKIMTFTDAFGPAPAGWTTTGIDGVVPTDKQRVLLTAQAAPLENGIWQVDGTGTTLVQPADYGG